MADFAAQRPGFGLRKQSAVDMEFLTALFVACSPLSTSLPLQMVADQARFREIGHEAAFPNASGWIVLSAEIPIGRIVIDWDTDNFSHCVDIALIPAEQGKGIGTHLLKAWTNECSLLQRDASLHVLATSPALVLYQRLGFVGSPDPGHPMIAMVRLA